MTFLVTVRAMMTLFAFPDVFVRSFWVSIATSSPLETVFCGESHSDPRKRQRRSSVRTRGEIELFSCHFWKVVPIVARKLAVYASLVVSRCIPDGLLQSEDKNFPVDYFYLIEHFARLK